MLYIIHGCPQHSPRRQETWHRWGIHYERLVDLILVRVAAVGDVVLDGGADDTARVVQPDTFHAELNVWNGMVSFKLHMRTDWMLLPAAKPRRSMDDKCPALHLAHRGLWKPKRHGNICN